MDPQSLSFTPQNDYWRLSNTVQTVQETQQEHADRLIRLERRQDDDAKVKSVWGPSSPFPSVLSSNPQLGAIGQPSGADFTSFDDDHSSNMVRSLQLDADEEPRRFGVGSRTNSVRFDDSANQGQWAHATRPSIDFLPRSSSGLGGLGGHPMFERSTSHKSDGRHSSAGQSAVSGRANSLGLDTTHLLARSPMDPPGLAPGLFILGAVPSIIRCWLNTNFKHESLLYAAVCTGSYRSFLDAALISALGFSDRIRRDSNGEQKIRVPVYLPEAVPHFSSSRSSSPAPQLPTLSVDFAVITRTEEQSQSKAIQIFLGSDTLRAHNADILFSSNSMTMFDDDRCKLSIPLVRPENDQTFKTLSITSVVPTTLADPETSQPVESAEPEDPSELEPNGTGHLQTLSGLGQTPISPSILKAREDDPQTDEKLDSNQSSIGKPSDEPVMTSEVDEKSLLGPPSGAKTEGNEVADESPPTTANSRRTSSPAIWGNWRRDSSGTSGSTQNDWANVSRNASSSYQRPQGGQGIKVLKPTRQSSRASAASFSPSPVTSQSRFFDDGKRRNGGGSSGGEPSEPQQALRRSASGESNKPGTKESTVTSSSSSKSRSANPIGGASAFGWLNSSQQK